MIVSIPETRISRIRTAVPTREIKIEDELEFYDGSLKKAIRAKKMIGTDRRRIAWPGQTAADLCEKAAQSVFNAEKGLQEKLDALIFVTQTPDYDFPATANILQAKLGITQKCATFDVNQGCSGYVYGLWLGASLINSGCSNVLLLTGDVPYRPNDIRNRTVAPIFGNGGSATLLQKNDCASPLLFSIGSDGSGFEKIIMPAGRGRIPFTENPSENVELTEDIIDREGTPWQLCNTYMDGPSIFKFTMDVIPRHLSEFMLESGFGMEAFEKLILHQANRQIVEAIARKLNFSPDRVPSLTFSRYGNLSSASIPATLCDVFGQCGTTGKCRLLLCGFGVGLSWASCIWETDNCDIKPVIDVEESGSDNSREEQINYWRCKIREKENDRA